MTDRLMARALPDSADWTFETDLRCTHDLRGWFVSVSTAAAQVLGYSQEDLVSIPMVDLVAPEFRHQFEQYVDELRRNGSADGMVMVRTRAGEKRVWQYRSRIQEGATGPVVRGAARDVTERVLTRQALRASEARFAAAFYSSPIALAITTVAEGRYVDVNEAFERQMGYSRVELLGHTSLELEVWPSPADRAAMIARLNREKTLRDQSAQFRTKSGQLIVTLYSASLVRLDSQPCVLAAIADVTAQKVAEHALRESESKFRLLAETTLFGIFIYRLDGAFCYTNPKVEAFTGYSSEELLSMAVWDLVHPDFRDLVRARAAARRRGDSVPTRYEIKITTKSGEERWIDFTALVIEFQGEPAILGTAFDVTETKRAEQQALEHTALLQTLIANSPFGILVGGRDHRVRFCNSAFQRIFLYGEDEVVGKDPDELVGLPGNAEARDFSRRVLSGQIVHGTTIRRRKDGSKVNVEVHAIPLMTGDGFTGCFGIYQDITERVDSEAKLRALRDRLTRVQDEERAHVARELHDNIGQRLALLALNLADLQKTARDLAPALAGEVEAARRLNDEICADVDRLSHRLHPSQLAYIGLSRALASLCEEFALKNGLEIEFADDEARELSPEITTCLYRVAQEAIRNAQKHSKCRRIEVELATGADAVRLSISDAGRGFDLAAAEGGSGLGLVSMAERVRSLGGEFSVWSAIDQGTRIEASIPCRTRG